MGRVGLRRRVGANPPARVTDTQLPDSPLDRTHFFTVDVEEYFQVAALEPYVARSSWDALGSRVTQATDSILALLEKHGATGTFFTLGWVSDRYPDLLRRIRAAGHEIASHGYGHQRITSLTPDEFRADIRRAKLTLEDVCGAAVDGYRAPSFSIVRGREWAFDILLEEGYRYDSSVFPIHRRGYGYPGAPLSPYYMRLPAGDLLELPLMTLSVAGAQLPAAGGAYLRLLPPALCHAAFQQATHRREPGMFYIHPWEIDAGQPRFAVSPLTRIRHYAGLGGMLARVDGMLSAFSFQSIAAWRAGLSPSALPVLNGPSASSR